MTPGVLGPKNPSWVSITDVNIDWLLEIARLSNEAAAVAAKNAGSGGREQSCLLLGMGTPVSDQCRKCPHLRIVPVTVRHVGLPQSMPAMSYVRCTEPSRKSAESAMPDCHSLPDFFPKTNLKVWSFPTKTGPLKFLNCVSSSGNKNATASATRETSRARVYCRWQVYGFEKTSRSATYRTTVETAPDEGVITGLPGDPEETLRPYNKQVLYSVGRPLHLQLVDEQDLPPTNHVLSSILMSLRGWEQGGGVHSEFERGGCIAARSYGVAFPLGTPTQ